MLQSMKIPPIRTIPSNNSGSKSAANQNLVGVKTLGRCFNERIDRKMGNFVDTDEGGIQNAYLTAIYSNFTPKLELEFTSISSSSGRDATSVMANSDRREHIGISASFENVSEKNNTLHVIITNDENRNVISDKVSELSVPGTPYDLQPHTRHSSDNWVFRSNMFPRLMSLD